MSVATVSSVEPLFVLERFVHQSARATILIAHHAFEGRLEKVDAATVTVKPTEPQRARSQMSGVPYALVALEADHVRGCFLAYVNRVGDDGRVAFDLPNQVSTVEQRRVRRQPIPQTMAVDARLVHDGGSCALRVSDVSAKGIGGSIHDGGPVPGPRADGSLVFGQPDAELLLPVVVAFVGDDRVGLQIRPDVRPELLLDFAAYLGRAAGGPG